MSKYFFITSFLFLLIINKAFSQNDGKDLKGKATISGYVKDATTGEFLIGANIIIKETYKGTVTNTYGFFSFTVDKGEYTLSSSYIGYSEFNKKVKLESDLKLDIQLNPSSFITTEVVIEAEKADEKIQNTSIGKMELEMEKIKTLPAFMGEVDIMKTIQLLPGIQSSGEGNSGFYVRGGGPDQNLIMIDEAVVYNPSHLFGFFSVFNSDAVKNIELTKGGMPANYGGRLASVIDVSMKDGNLKKIHAEGGIGLISSRLTVHGPIKKDTSSFLISGRRTYIDVLAEPFIKETSDFKGSGYYFYDFNTKLNYKLSDKDRLFVSGYYGRDFFTYKNKKSGFDINIPWGNTTASIRWNHLFSNKLFLNTTAVFSDYKFQLIAKQSDFEFKLFSGIKDINTKLDFSYFSGFGHEIKFGTNYIYHTFTPNNASAKQGEVVFEMGEIVKLFAHETAVYVTDEFDIGNRIRINAGIRYSNFTQVGPFDRYVKNEIGETIDTLQYEPNKKVIGYGGPEPRLSLRYKLSSSSSIKAAYTYNYQYIHLVSLSSISMPTDVWVPSSSLVKPQIGNQYTIGVFKNFKENHYETSIETYYKDMQNQVEYKEGALPEDDLKNNPDNNFTFGSGRSYGVEFFVKKVYGKFNGWIGYTVSKTIRQFPEINKGKEFYAKFDRRHDLSVVTSYDLSERWTVSGIFVYGTGNAITLPVARYFIEGQVVNEYAERNSFRMPAYHRADLSVTFKSLKTKKFESDWNFSVYNVYNRYNPFFIYFEDKGNHSKGEIKIVAKQVSLFPILPSVTWNFKF